MAGVKVSPGGWADLFLERSSLSTLEWNLRSGHRQDSGLREGMALRRVEAGEQRLLTEEGLSEERLFALCGGIEPLPLRRPAAPRVGEETTTNLQSARIDQAAHSLLSAIGGLGPEAGSVTLKVELRSRETIVARIGAPARRNLTSRVVMICRLGTGSEAISVGLGAATLDALLDRDPVQKLLRQIRMRVEDLTDAREAPAGSWPVILSSGTGGVFFHEACGHALEGDLVLRAASPFRSQLGSRIAPTFLGAMDDATQPGLEGSYASDDEGVSGRGTVLIAKGILKSFLSDRITGGRLGCGSTGNGRRESFRDLPLPRMSNAFVMAGEDDPEAILRETPRGIFVGRLGGGRMDPSTGDFRFTATSGSLIESGRLTAPLRPFLLAGNGPAALRAIRRVGSDLSFGEGAGSCGKEGQLVAVASGLPTLLLDSLEVAPR